MAWRVGARLLGRFQPRLSWTRASRYPLLQTRGFLGPQKRTCSFTPSADQTKVAKLCETQNVVVSALPGSGKTATAEAIAAAHPNKRIALFTYSRGLLEETQKRLQHYENCMPLTFHSMAGRLFNTLVFNDTKLREQRHKARRDKILPQWDGPPFDIIILDEFQDCTDILFWLTNCFISANNKKKGGDPARLVVLGDERQCIYQYRAADPRYLSLAPELFKSVTPYPFAQVPLSQSFRLSNETVQFVNRAFLGGEPYMTSSKPGPQPIFLRSLPFDTVNLAESLSGLIKSYGPENTAILAPSIRNNAEIQALTNRLSEHHDIPICVQLNGEGSFEKRVTAGKLCVSSVHQFKGSERDLVILFGIDSTFFEYFGRSLPDNRCPNETFVALTRAAKQLVLVHIDTNKPMPFVSVGELHKTAHVVNMTKSEKDIARPYAPGRPPKFGLCLRAQLKVSDMIRHLPDESTQDIIEGNVCIQKVSPPLPRELHIDVAPIVSSNRQRNFYEKVDDLNGLAVVASLEHYLTGSLKTFGLDGWDLRDKPPIFSQKYPSWLCRQACKYDARITRYRSRDHQMRYHRFNWMSPEHLIEASTRLRRELLDAIPNLDFEVKINETFHIDLQKVHLQGRADIVEYSPNAGCNQGNEIETIWEIKFVLQLSYQHVVQACAYAYLLSSQSGKVPRVVLFNVRDGEKWEITPRNGREGLRRVIESVLKLKYTTVVGMKDEEFVQMCSKTMEEVQKYS